METLSLQRSLFPCPNCIEEDFILKFDNNFFNKEEIDCLKKSFAWIFNYLAGQLFCGLKEEQILTICNGFYFDEVLIIKKCFECDKHIGVFSYNVSTIPVFKDIDIFEFENLVKDLKTNETILDGFIFDKRSIEGFNYGTRCFTKEQDVFVLLRNSLTSLQHIQEKIPDNWLNLNTINLRLPKLIQKILDESMASCCCSLDDFSI